MPGTDEPRRSGRATKGQNTKDRDIEEDGSKKKSKSNSSKAKEAQETEGAEELIRCICGQYEEEEDTERDMICCDNCSAWQHNDCMLLPYPADEAPETYFCEQCKPGDHKELLAAIARGERPWEEVARRREAAEAEKTTKKKKGGKKGRKTGSRPSEPVSEASPGLDLAQTPAKGVTGNDNRELSQEPASGSAGLKRKLEENTNGASIHQDAKKPRAISVNMVASPVEDQPKVGRSAAQQRKSSGLPTPTKPESRSDIPPGPVSSVEQLPPQRRSIAASLIKLFTTEADASAMHDQAKCKLPEGQTAASVGTNLGLGIEEALYRVLCHGIGEPNDAYKAQYRTINFNVKKNEDLRHGLLNGSLTGENLARMSPEDMASKEQQLRDAKIKQEQEKQHVIVQDQGPRIRRTHKGDEYIEDAQQVAAEPDIMQAPVRRATNTSEAEGDQARRSSAAPTVTAPTSADERALSINTQARPLPSTDPPRKSSQAFDIQDVWSGVQGSPHGDRPAFPQIQYSNSGQVQKNEQTEADPDIDALLKDEGIESPPYSPKSLDGDRSVIWHGSINMTPIARFQGTAQKAAGADVANLGLTWQQLIPDVLTVEGRIDPARADSYLCGLRYSSTSDVIVVAVRAAENPHDRHQFDVLFNYFQTRHRYGVGVSSLNPAIKDIYLIPLEAGSDRKPELLQLLDNDEVETPVSENTLLVPFVVKTNELNANTAASASNTPAASTNTSPIGTGSIGMPNAAAPSSAPQAATLTPSSQPAQPNHQASFNQQQPQQQPEQQSTSHASTFQPPNPHQSPAPPHALSYSQPTPSPQQQQQQQQQHSFPPPPQPSQRAPDLYQPSLAQAPLSPLPAPPPSTYPPPQSQPHLQQPQSHPQPLQGADAITRVLGPQALLQLPALQQLIQQAPTVGTPEIQVVAECIRENAEAGKDLRVLQHMLIQRQSGQGSGTSGGPNNGDGPPAAGVAAGGGV